MWPQAYFPRSYFAARYWPKTGEEAPNTFLPHYGAAVNKTVGVLISPE